MIVEPRRSSTLAILFLTVARERNESHTGDGIAGAQVSGHFVTISLWKSHVEEHDLRPQAFHRLKSSISAVGGFRFVSVALEQHCKPVRCVNVVIDDKHAALHRRARPALLPHYLERRRDARQSQCES